MYLSADETGKFTSAAIIAERGEGLDVEMQEGILKIHR